MTKEVQMHRAPIAVLIVAALLGGVSGAGAGVIGPNVILSSPQDLAHLTVGSQAEIDVTLQGLPDSHFIFNLDTRVLFPTSNFQLVSGPTATTATGSVFFADNQVADFNAHSGPIPGGGGVIGDFADETASGVGAIGQNGLYYSFVVQAIAPGSGTIEFDLVTPGGNQFSGTDSVPPFAFSTLPTGPPLPFTIAGAAVPEPTSGLLAVIGMSVSGLWIVRGSRSRREAR